MWPPEETCHLPASLSPRHPPSAPASTPPRHPPSSPPRPLASGRDLPASSPPRHPPSAPASSPPRHPPSAVRPGSGCRQRRQVYMLKVEGIAFRFLPDPLQIKNALELKSTDRAKWFDGVPVFQSEALVIKKKNKRYCPIYFQKEDIERDLLKSSKVSRGLGVSQHVMVGSLEDVLRKMEMNDKDSGWEDLIFVPPGKGVSEHINEVAA